MSAYSNWPRRCVSISMASSTIGARERRAAHSWGSRLRYRRVLLGIVVAVAEILGCSEPRHEHDAREKVGAAVEAKTAADSELGRRLAALGYLDYVDEPDVAPHLGVTVWKQGLTDDGYSLYVVRRACKAFLIAMDGTVVRSWQSDTRKCIGWDNAELLPQGDLVVPEIGLGLRRYDFAGRVRRVIRLPAHHDVTARGARHLVTLTRIFRVIPEVHRAIKTADDGITLVTGFGKGRETVSLWDLFAGHPLGMELEAIRPHAPRGRSGEGFVDVFHANSVEWMERPDLAARDPIYALDNVLVSVRNQNLVIIVNWPTKKIVWAWGRADLSKQHDASVLPNGHLLIFDNGVRKRRSRVVEVDPIRSEIVWEYDGGRAGKFYTPGMGSAQRLSNGNTLFAVSNSGYFREVTPDGHIVWEYRSPHMVGGRRGTVVRVRRYPKSKIEALLARTS